MNHLKAQLAAQVGMRHRGKEDLKKHPSKRVERIALVRSCFLIACALPLMAQDAVNPCAVQNETLNCTQPAVIKLHKIRLNGERRKDPYVPLDSDVVIKAALDYETRGTGTVTTSFTGGCPDRVEEARIKPPVPVIYNAVLDNGTTQTPYSGSGLAFTIPASDLAELPATLQVTYSVDGKPNCIDMDQSQISVTQNFVIDVDKDSYVGTITAFEDTTHDTTDYGKSTPIIVYNGDYFLRNQAKTLRLTAQFNRAGRPLTGGEDVQWRAEIDTSVQRGQGHAGTFDNGARRQTVTFKLGDLEYGKINFIATLTREGKSYEETFSITIIHIDTFHNAHLKFNQKRSFLIPPSHIHPAASDVNKIAALFSKSSLVGSANADGIRLRTRSYTNPSSWNNLNNESFKPTETEQKNAQNLIVEQAIFKVSNGNLFLEIQVGSTLGTYNLTWEMKTNQKTGRRFLHRVPVKIYKEDIFPNLSITQKNTNNAGPFILSQGETLALQAHSSKTWTDGLGPKWSIIQKPLDSALAPPTQKSDTWSLTFNSFGTYKIKIEDAGGVAEAVIEVLGIDIDTDSDNSATFAEASHSLKEDAMEDIANDYQNPGKMLSVSTQDRDGDFIPDYADGYNWFPAGTNFKVAKGSQFVSFTIRVPEYLNPSVAKIYFDFDEALIGKDITCSGNSDTPDCIRKSAADYGRNRIWTLQADKERIRKHIPQGHNIGKAGYLLKDLGFPNQLSGPEANRIRTFYFEALHGSETFGHEHITVKLDHDGDGIEGTSTPAIAEDTIRFTAIDVEMISTAKERSFYDSTPDDGLTTLEVKPKPGQIVTAGTLDWSVSRHNPLTPSVPISLDTGQASFRKDATSTWAEKVLDDDDTKVDIRADAPGPCTLTVTYKVNGHNFDFKYAISVPRFYKLNWGTFKNDLTFIGLQNTHGTATNQLTSVRNAELLSQVQAKIMTWVEHRFDSKVNYRLLTSTPSFIKPAFVTKINVGGSDLIKNGGTQSSGESRIGNFKPKVISIYSSNHANDKLTNCTTYRFQVSKNKPITNANYFNNGPIKDYEYIYAIEMFSRSVGTTLVHEMGHSMGLLHNGDSGSLEAEEMMGYVMDKGEETLWGHNVSSGTGFSPTNMTALSGWLPKSTHSAFK